MAPNYLLAIFHWRNHAGDLDDQQSSGSLSTLLYGCERWLELNVGSIDTDDGRRLIMIKRELEYLLERDGKLPTHVEPSSTMDYGPQR